MSRYLQQTQKATVQNLQILMTTLSANLAGEDEYGAAVREQPYISPSRAKDCVKAIDSLPPGELLDNYVYLACQDLMSGPSFVWDLRKGEIPETGSSSTLAHSEISLAPGRQYFQQFVNQGECEPLIGEGWAQYYYSETCCMATLKSILPFVGKDWSVETRRVEKYQGVPQSLVAIFRSRIASEVAFALTFVGQGRVRWIPDILVAMHSGQEFFNVLDTDYNRSRCGCERSDGEIWQYP